MSDDIPECRICFEIESYDDPFISPCLCKGTSKYVHKSCLNTWRHFNVNREGWDKCMECHEIYTLQYKYPIEKDILANNHYFLIWFTFECIPFYTPGLGLD